MGIWMVLVPLLGHLGVVDKTNDQREYIQDIRDRCYQETIMGILCCHVMYGVVSMPIVYCIVRGYF